MTCTDRERKFKLWREWRFDCQCPLCVAEGEDGEELLAQRHKLEEVGDAFAREQIAIILQRRSRPSDSFLRKTKDMLRIFYATYDRQRYSKLPRTAIYLLSSLLVYIHYHRDEYAETLKAAREFLFDVGYTDISFDSDNIVIGGAENAIAVTDAVNILRMLATVKVRLGEQSAVEALEVEIKRLYVAINGLETGYKSVWEIMKEGIVEV